MARFKSLIIVCHGRSGSTLLQGILNATPGFLIRGENHDFSAGLYMAYRRIKRAASAPQAARLGRTDDPTVPWYGAADIDQKQVLADMTILMRNVLVPKAQQATVACYGFKEIRFPQGAPKFASYTTFLRSIMPELAVVLLTRNHESLSRSGWWKKEPKDRLIRRFAKTDAARKSYIKQHADHGFHIEYEDICAQGPQTHALFDFLGVPYSVERVTEVLSVKHGNAKNPGADFDDDEDEMPEDDDEEFDDDEE